ncbi:hypothetical protein FKM82_017637 [Ascaphus truei]
MKADVLSSNKSGLLRWRQVREAGHLRLGGGAGGDGRMEVLHRAHDPDARPPHILVAVYLQHGGQGVQEGEGDQRRSKRRGEQLRRRHRPSGETPAARGTTRAHLLPETLIHGDSFCPSPGQNHLHFPSTDTPPQHPLPFQAS